MAFKPIRVKFKPSAKDVQVCEESGVDLAQAVHKAVRAQERQAGSSQVKTGWPKPKRYLHASVFSPVGCVQRFYCPEGSYQAVYTAARLQRPDKSTECAHNQTGNCIEVYQAYWAYAQG